MFLISGCVSLGDDGLPTVSSNPFSSTPQQFTETKTAYAPASEEVGKRVAVMGQKIIAMNPAIALRPRFITIGSPQLELMHIGTSDLYITEGLVKRCETDGQLAAVLSQEIAKMVVEREILTQPAARIAAREAPPAMPVGQDSGGIFGSPDGTRLVELARFDKERHRPTDPEPPPPSPEILARGYFEKAGFPLSELDAVAPLLREADANGTLYRKVQAAQIAAPPAK